MKTVFLWLALVSVVAKGASQITLPASGIRQLKKRPCVFLHVWATWCSICIEEMPAVVKFLSERKKITPVILDVSAPGVQKGFSRAWMKTLKPPFATYFKPPSDEGRYLAAIDPSWSGALPYTAVFHAGKKRKEWIGALDFPGVDKEIAAICH